MKTKLFEFNITDFEQVYTIIDEDNKRIHISCVNYNYNITLDLHSDLDTQIEQQTKYGEISFNNKARKVIKEIVKELKLNKKGLININNVDSNKIRKIFMNTLYHYHKRINRYKSSISFVGLFIGFCLVFYTVSFMDIYNYKDIHMAIFDWLYGKSINEESSLIEIVSYYDVAFSTSISVMILSVIYIIGRLLLTFSIGYIIGITSIYLFVFLFLKIRSVR